MPTPQFARYMQEFAEVPGWFDHNAIALWDSLLTFQEEQRVAGDFLEIGVWKGKSASLQALHVQAGERAVFVDIQPTPEAQAIIAEKVPGAKCAFVQSSSDKLAKNATVKELKGRARWVHVDGGHRTQEVLDDLETADRVLGDKGIVALDDFFSPAYPQVPYTVFRYMEKNPRKFAMILVGYHKAYLCRPKAKAFYLGYMKDRLYADMVARGCGSVTVWKTNDAREINSFGISDAGSDAAGYRGLDTEQDRIYV